MDNEELEPPKRQRSKDPHHEKQLDYQHQRRSTEGGQGWRKARASLPRRERKLIRRTQERALRQSMLDPEGAGLAAGDSVRGAKRSRFILLDNRREIPLGKRVSIKKSGEGRIQYWLPVGRKIGRHLLPHRSLIALWAERNEKEKPGEVNNRGWP
jgi:hypothetical protein